MNQQRQLNLTDVNEFLYCLIGFDYFLKNLKRYNLTLDQACSNPTSFKRLLLCFKHSKKTLKNWPYVTELDTDEDLRSFIRYLLIKKFENYVTKKKD